MPTGNTYSSGSFLLELQGTSAGRLTSVEGGAAVGAVVEEPLGSSGIVPKHLGVVSYTPLRISFSAGMSQALYDWIGEFVARGRTVRDGAIVFLDHSNRETERLEFDAALITELVIPALDVSSRDGLKLELAIQPTVTRTNSSQSGRSVVGVSGNSSKRPSASGFQLRVSGLETETTRAPSIESLVVRQPDVRSDPAAIAAPPVQVPNLAFRLPLAFSAQSAAWFQDFVVAGNNGAAQERNATLDLLDASRTTTFFSLVFSNLGITSMGRERIETNAQVVAQLSLECYCEAMSFSATADAIGQASGGGSTSGGAPTNGGAPPSGNSSFSDADIADVLAGLSSGRLTREDAIRATLLLATAAPADASSATDPALDEAIARRLQAATPLGGTSAPALDRATGVRVGQEWGAKRATLEELKEIATLDDDKWTGIKLREGHTLLAALRDVGAIDQKENGPIEVARDAFAEGVVAGAADVFRRAAPHLEKKG